MDKLILDRMEFYGFHGFYVEERALGQRFFLDLEMHLDLKQAGSRDDLSQTVNYVKVYEEVKEIVQNRSYFLIERLGEKVAQYILNQYPNVELITVRVTKPHPPCDIHFKGVIVEITRKRENND